MLTGALDKDELLGGTGSADGIDSSLHVLVDNGGIDVVRLVHEVENDVGVVDLQSRLTTTGLL